MSWAGGRPLPSIAHWRRRAQGRLPRFVMDYIDGGAESEATLALNRADLDAIRLAPRVLQGIDVPDLQTELFGRRQDLPLAIAPMGLAGLVRPGGDCLLAQAAQAAGVPFVLSTAANATFDQIAAAGLPPPWFQLYVVDHEAAASQVAAARDLGCPVLMLTVDVPVGGARWRDMENGFHPGGLPSRTIVTDTLAKPAWAISQEIGRAHV